MTGPLSRERVAQALVNVSVWVDEANTDRDPEALSWHRVTKIAEETGEVIEAMIGWTGGNPRKGVSHTIHDVIKESLDTAMAALGAVEHLTGNQGDALDMLDTHILAIAKRAGVGP